MLTAIVVFLRTIGLICCGHRAVALEILALRQQLAALKRSVKRPRLRASDRLFWMLLANVWRDWRRVLVLVQPATVVRWHREWLRRRWAARSRQSRPLRPATDAALRTLIAKMSAANPLYPDISAPITIQCSRRLGGQRTCGFWRSTLESRVAGAPRSRRSRARSPVAYEARDLQTTRESRVITSRSL